MTEAEAKPRFFTLALFRSVGVFVAFLGIPIIARRLIEPAETIAALGDGPLARAIAYA